MVNKVRRLPRPLFQLVFTAGQRSHSAHFTVVYEAGESRVSVVAGKKVSRLATVRNRLRRRAYGVLARCGVSGQVIVIYKVGAATTPRLELQHELETVLARIEKAG